MKKLMMIGLMTIAPLVATPAQSMSDTVKLALAGTGFVGSIAHALEPGPHNLSVIGLAGGAGWVLNNLIDQSKSLLIRGTSKAIISYSALAMLAQELARDPNFAGAFGVEFDKTGAFLYRTLIHLSAIGYAVGAASGIKDIINGIAEKFESNQKQIEHVVDHNNQPAIQDAESKFLDILNSSDLGWYWIQYNQLPKGIDIDKPVDYQYEGYFIALHIATQLGHYDRVVALLDAGANVDSRNESGYTTLHIAAFNGYTDIAKILLERGAHVNASGKENYTPLHAAVAQRHVEMVKLLLAYSADPEEYYGDLSANYGSTYIPYGSSYGLASAYGYEEIVQLFAKHENRTK